MRKVTRIARAALGALVLSSSMVMADCKIVTGTVSPLQPVPPQLCASFYGCFTGTFSGDLSGSFQSVLTNVTLLPTGPSTVTLNFTALTAIETRAPNGTLYTSDAGSSSCTVDANGQTFCANSNEVLTIISGLRAYAQAHGSINLSGGYMAGQPGVYHGQICTGNAR